MSHDRSDPTSHAPDAHEALGEVLREHVLLADRDFVIERPGDSDALMDHPAVRALLAADDYLPHWTEIWPAARMLAKWIVRQKWPAGLRALEIGCGLGVAGIAALSVGLHVTFSDCDATALEFAADNAVLNGYSAFDTMQLDWRYPPAGVSYPVLLASDLIYEYRHVTPVIQLIKQLLAPVGVCLLTDQDRVPSQVVRDTLTSEGLTFTTQLVRAGEPGGRRAKGTLYRITQPGGRDPLAE